MSRDDRGAGPALPAAPQVRPEGGGQQGGEQGEAGQDLEVAREELQAR